VVNVANAGATTYLPTIAAQRGISQSAIQLIGVVVTAVAVGGYLVCAYVGTVIGRRNAMAVFYGIGIVMGVLVTFLGRDAVSFGLLYSLWWFFAYGIYGCAITYIMESFPTRVRGTGSNFVGQWVWAGFVVYTLAAGWILQTLGATAALLVFLVGVAAVAFVILLFNRNIDPGVYSDLDELRDDIVDAYRKELRALAQAGCRYVQLDEVPIAMYCDPRRVEHMSRGGIDVNKVLFRTFPDLINAALAGRPASLHVAMHLCRGNNQSGWLTEGGYDPVAEMLFNEINVDSYFLEYDTARAGTFEPLRFVPANKSVVLGIVSSKVSRLESADELKRRIDEAAEYADIDQLGLSPQCGFASTAPGNRVSFEDQTAKLRRIVEVAREVWG